MRMSESIKDLAAALVLVQLELTPVTKDKVNPFFQSRYVGLESVMPAALALLSKYNIALAQTVGTAEDGIGTTLSTTLLHVSGEWLTDTQPLLLAKADAQGQGSAITYARRYGLMSALGIVAEEDDDGNKATPRPRQKAQRKSAAVKSAPKEQPASAQDNISNNTSLMWTYLYRIYNKETQREDMLNFLEERFPFAMSTTDQGRYFDINKLSDAELAPFVKDLEAIAPNS